jgi:gamma-tubulin complex component 2
VSVVKLQSLLDLALNADAHGEDTLFREDIKVTMAESGLYDFLLKVVTVSGVLKAEEGGEEDTKKEKEEKKSILGLLIIFISKSYTSNRFSCGSHRRLDFGLQC